MCLTPECKTDQVFCRGLCRRCYERAQKRIRRGTLTWGELIDQGLAKRAACAGASSDVRRQAQLAVNKVRKGGKNPYGLSDAEWASAVREAKRHLSEENLTESERLHYQGILSLADQT